MGVSQKTALILTSALTDGSFSLITWKPFDHDTTALKHAASQALRGAAMPLAASVFKAIDLPLDTHASKPLLLHDAHVTGATYHHGSGYEHFVFGPLTSILRISDCSDNEREKMIQFARQQTTLGYVTYGIAQGQSHTDVTELSQLEGTHRLDFLGAVILQPQLYPETLRRLSEVKQKYDSLHYVATGDDYYASSVAIQAGLLPASGSLTLKSDSLSPKQSTAALLPKRAYESLIRDRSHTRIFDEPLS